MNVVGMIEERICFVETDEKVYWRDGMGQWWVNRGDVSASENDAKELEEAYKSYKDKETPRAKKKVPGKCEGGNGGNLIRKDVLVNEAYYVATFHPDFDELTEEQNNEIVDMVRNWIEDVFAHENNITIKPKTIHATKHSNGDLIRREDARRAFQNTGWNTEFIDSIPAVESHEVFLNHCFDRIREERDWYRKQYNEFVSKNRNVRHAEWSAKKIDDNWFAFKVKVGNYTERINLCAENDPYGFAAALGIDVQ